VPSFAEISACRAIEIRHREPAVRARIDADVRPCQAGPPSADRACRVVLPEKSALPSHRSRRRLHIQTAPDWGHIGAPIRPVRSSSRRAGRAFCQRCRLLPSREVALSMTCQAAPDWNHIGAPTGSSGSISPTADRIEVLPQDALLPPLKSAAYACHDAPGCKQRCHASGCAFMNLRMVPSLFAEMSAFASP